MEVQLVELVVVSKIAFAASLSDIPRLYARRC